MSKDKSEELDWKSEWKDMPDYSQGDKKAVKRVVINFETVEDMEEFNKITGLSVTMKTKGVFYPQKEYKKIIYVGDEVPSICDK